MDVEPERAARVPSLAVLETVRCLECGALYSKPCGGGTVQQNPGCPECGYVGWLSAAVPLKGAPPRRRPASDRPPHLHVRSR